MDGCSGMPAPDVHYNPYCRLTMDELLAKMTQHAKVEAEEKQRLMLFTLNGQARRDPGLEAAGP